MRPPRAVIRAAAGLTGPLTVVLFGGGLLFGDLLGTTNFPPIDASMGTLRTYISANAADVRALGFFHELAALSLATFTIVLATRLRRAAPECLGRAIGVAVGGALAAAFLLLSAVCYRVLAEPSIVAGHAVGNVLLVLSYLFGGPALAGPLALLEFSAGSLALRAVLLPRWLGWLGIVAGASSLLSTLYLLVPFDNRSVLYAILLLAAVLGFLWLGLGGIALALPGDWTTARAPGRAPR